MQDTDNFINLLNQFRQYQLTSLIDSPQYVGEPSRQVVVESYEKLNEYFSDESFRSTLSLPRRTSIENQVANMVSQLSTLYSYQQNGTPISQGSGNIENIVSNLRSYMDDFDLRYTDKRQMYFLQQQGGVDEIVRDIKKYSDNAQATLETMQTRLQDADLMIGDAGSMELSDYYQRLANGRSTHEQDSILIKDKKTINIKDPFWILLAAPIIWLAVDKVNTLRVEGYTFPWLFPAIVSVGVPLAVVVFIYAFNWFNRSFKGGYERSSMFWMIGAVIATIGTAIYAGVLVGALSVSGDGEMWQRLIPAIISLLAPAYFVRFCVQNYKASMHLAIQNTHKATVSRTAGSFSKMIATDMPSLKESELKGRNDVVQAAAQVVFAPNESGYITTKEGAGGSDNMLEGLNKIK